jgi:valyl-tRNA synthetase
LKLAKEKLNFNYTDLRQDVDALDTWFSSWLWPMSVLAELWIPKVTILNTIIQQTIWLRVQIFYFSGWRMIIAGYEYTDKPFTNVYLTGLVRDKQRRKMSKSLGNS